MPGFELYDPPDPAEGEPAPLMLLPGVFVCANAGKAASINAAPATSDNFEVAIVAWVIIILLLLSLPKRMRTA
jgi:hypothetical protein